jgi:hypothetical protein
MISLANPIAGMALSCDDSPTHMDANVTHDDADYIISTSRINITAQHFTHFYTKVYVMV